MKKHPPLDPRILKRSFLASFARVVGVALGAGAGSLIYNLTGGKLIAWPIAITMSIVSFVFLWFVEYEREIQQ